MKYKFSKFFVRGGDEVSFLTANCWLGLGSLIGQKVPWGELGKQLLLRGSLYLGKMLHSGFLGYSGALWRGPRRVC